MKKLNENLILSASDLVNYLNCNHLTALDVQVAKGVINKPNHYDPLLELLRERGCRHEESYIEFLHKKGIKVTILEGFDISEAAVNATRAAMENGDEIIVQAAFSDGIWHGRADILRRVEIPSDLGTYSYEIIDTKLARETKGGTVLQLCLYADLLRTIQGITPEFIYVVSPWSDFEPQRFRFDDYAAYYRRVKMQAEEAIKPENEVETYPEPKIQCDVCRWENQCDTRRRKDDHLCLVAGISKTQINEFQLNGIGTLKALATMPVPLPFKPQKGSPHSFEKVRDQAAIQVEARECGEKKYVLLDLVPEFGLAALPEPSAGDVFFDIESNQFVGEHGIEYLFGYVYYDENGEGLYLSDWAFDRENEKKIFENFIDFVTERRKKYPEMHIYHYAGYEAGALKRLMGRYATRESEVDNLLRGRVLVDLHRVTCHAIRASVESYSLKKLEPFFDFERQITLHEANVALTKLTTGLELNDIPAIDDETKITVAKYNEDDCLSTEKLQKWLEGLRNQLVGEGKEIPRPESGQEGPSEEIDEQQKRINELIESLTIDVSIDPDERTKEQQAQWILAYTLDWHRRELKAVWWEYFRLRDLNVDELIDEKSAIGRLQYLETIDYSKTGIPTDRYYFEPQDTDLRGDEELRNVGGDRLGKAIAVSTEDQTIDIKKMKSTANIHPNAIFAHKVIDPVQQAASLIRLGQYVADHGVEGNGDHKAARDLLLMLPMECDGQHFQYDGEEPLNAALRLTEVMRGGVLPIQGPPGTGKSFTGARMICELVRQGKKVGITANSHKVISNLINKVIEAKDERGISFTCLQKPEGGHKQEDDEHLKFARTNDKVISDIANQKAQVVGATPFFWSREDAKNLVDVLVVDEAGQMSLANVLAVAQAAQSLVLLGDPQQLEQPTQGTHPDGTGVSALDHLLGNALTIKEGQGLFLGTTYRLNPEICTFISELFYESKLSSVSGCELQNIDANGLISGSGLRYLPIEHEGNTSSSIEEAEAVKSVVELLLANNPYWTDRQGEVHKITLKDILIITPYNAQVFEIKKRLPEANVGTVDKFQGQEAPIAIYSMATSSHADAPRGMEFLYSANRFNVAISRAKCLAILIGSPQVFETECRTPRQMQLANAFCRYLELSEDIKLA